MNKYPEVSMVMSVYNGASHLAATLDSVLSQEGVEFEFIVVNDGSRDKSAQILDEYAQKHKAGRVVCNDSAIITERDPDTVRGADVAYYSYKRVAKGKLPKGYMPAPPESVFEVRSPADRPGKLLTKVGEYLAVGVDVVCVIDPDAETITEYVGDQEPRVLRKGETLDLSKIMPAFRVPVARFFEED